MCVHTGRDTRQHAMFKISRRSFKSIVIITLITAFLGACQSSGPTLFDQTIPPDRWIRLADGGPHTGKADARNAVVAYTYTQQPSSKPHLNLAVSGQILSVRRNSIQVNVYLLALDGQGKAISRNIVYASGYGRSTYFRQTWTFDKYVTLPPETATIAFDALTKTSRGRR